MKEKRKGFSKFTEKVSFLEETMRRRNEMTVNKPRCMVFGVEIVPAECSLAITSKEKTIVLCHPDILRIASVGLLKDNESIVHA